MPGLFKHFERSFEEGFFSPFIRKPRVEKLTLNFPENSMRDRQKCHILCRIRSTCLSFTRDPFFSDPATPCPPTNISVKCFSSLLPAIESARRSLCNGKNSIFLQRVTYVKGMYFVYSKICMLFTKHSHECI